jgi:centrosomal protein CEP104
LGFNVCHCPSEEEGFAGAQLQYHTVDAVGWSCGRFPNFPVEIGIQFEGVVMLRSIDILAHEFKIASKVDVFVCDGPAGNSSHFPQYNRVQWQRLGHFCLTSNKETEYKARELKTVQINRPTPYLRLLFAKCHLNPYNFFNQVGIVGLDAFGDVVTPLRLVTPIRASPAPEVDLKALRPPSSTVRMGKPGAGGFDVVTAQKIKELEALKAEAVRNEEYDNAKQFKVRIDALRNVATKLYQLENDKRNAIAAEDYDQAKALKLEVEAIRRQAAGIADRPIREENPTAFLTPALMQAKSPEIMRNPQYPQYQPQQAAHGPSPPPNFDDLPVGGAKPQQAEPVATGFDHYDDIPVGNTKAQSLMVAKDMEQIMNSTDPFGLKRRPSVVLSRQSVSAVEPTNYIAHERRDGYEDNNAANGDVHTTGSGPSAADMESKEEHTAETDDERPPAPFSRFDPKDKAKWEVDLFGIIESLNSESRHLVEDLPESKASEAKLYAEAFGDVFVECLLSKRWQLREMALKAIARRIAAKQPFGVPYANVFQLSCRFLVSKGNGLKDTVANVFYSSCELLEVMSCMETQLAPQQLMATLSPCLQDLVVKSADTNARTKDVAIKLLKALANDPTYGPAALYIVIIGVEEDPKSKKNSWRTQLAKLHIVSILLEVGGLQSQEKTRQGLDVQNVMTQAVVPGLQNPNNEVRNEAIAIIAALSCLVDDRAVIDEHLEGLKPALLVAIEQAISLKAGEEDSEPDSLPDRQAAPASRKSLVQSQPLGRSDSTRDKTAEIDALAEQIEELNRRKDQAPPGPQAAAAVEDEDDFTTCQFCGKQDPTWDEEALDKHYEESCPWLTCCEKCEQVVEIPFLREHAVTDCEARDPSDGAVVGSNASCPLCGEAIDPTEGGWTAHLLVAPGCPNNTRPLDAAAPS